ncbi:MAG: MATE family efflux transporter [Chlamydiota bacterium]|nr:MATE family efflux transporter [Chlamydiota bacterium]
MSRPSYQLTKYPLGSLRECWTISWPLILSLLSFSVMLFTDRILLSRHSVTELNAAAAAGTACWLFLVMPVSIAAISEVFVGRYHGENRLHELGKPVWQMIWFSLIASPILWLVGTFGPPLLFFGSPNIHEETTYFSTILVFTPVILANIAVTGFFVGSGRVKIVTVCAIITNIINIGLDYLLIYGYKWIPSLGIFGAGIATGLCELVQLLLFLSFFFKKSNRENHGTLDYSFDKRLFSESLRIGFPAGLGIAIEISAHFIFFKAMIYAGQENLTIAAMVQSLYFLIFFIYEGLSKGVTTICANLLGGKQKGYIKQVLISASSIHAIFFLILSSLILFNSDHIIDYFLNQQDENLIVTPHFLNVVHWGIFFMCLFFLFDGLTRILAGHLTAAGDTKFLLYAGTVLNLVAYVLPIFLIIFYAEGGADDAWMIIFSCSVMTFSVYLLRYISNKWEVASAILEQSES